MIINRLQTLFLLLLCSYPFSSPCGERNSVTVYPIHKEKHYSVPLNRTTYTIVGKNRIIGKLIPHGILEEYENCIILSIDDWECRFSDGSGSFGIRNGKFYRYPGDQFGKIKHVSEEEYSLLKCGKNSCEE